MLLSVLLLALRSVQRNLLRSFLTILGIVIGVAAVITMVTLGNGATTAIEAKIASLGTNLLVVSPGQRIGGGGGSGVPQFTEADAEAAGPRQRHRGGQRPQLGHQRERQHQRLVQRRQLGAGRRPLLHAR